MVDVASKAVTTRTATASARVMLGPQAYPLLEANNSTPKGNVLAVAQLAGIQAAKATSSLIPLCHNVPLSSASVSFKLEPKLQAVRVIAEAKTVGRTGVEMEAMTAAAVASMTIYDMVKGVARDVEIQNVRLESKSGGKSGAWKRVELLDLEE